MSEYAVAWVTLPIDRTFTSQRSHTTDRSLWVCELPISPALEPVLRTVPTTLERAQSALMAFLCGGEVPDELIYQGDPT